MEKKVIVIGGGWSGVAAAVAAKKCGADVTVVEKTDLLLGLGNVGGIMRNNGRFTAAEENIALGASELFEITDRYSRHRNVDFPGHSHASLYDVFRVEPAVRRLLKEMDIGVKTIARAVDAEYENATEGRHISSIILADGTKIPGDVFIETTGSTGPMGNCLTYGNGCSMYRAPADALQPCFCSSSAGPGWDSEEKEPAESEAEDNMETERKVRFLTTAEILAFLGDTAVKSVSFIGGCTPDETNQNFRIWGGSGTVSTAVQRERQGTHPGRQADCCCVEIAGLHFVQRRRDILRAGMSAPDSLFSASSI